MHLLSFFEGLDFAVVWQYRIPMAHAFLRTLFFTFVAVSAGFLLSIVVAILSQTRVTLLRWLLAAYVELIRNTPFPVQLFWIYFALPVLSGVNLTVTQSAIVTLVASNVAYATEIVRAGIEGIPKGQWDAATALALPRRATWGRVIIPQALRIVLPALVSNTLSVFKATAILSILAVNELMLVTQRLSTYTGRPIEFYTSAAAIYFVVGALFVVIGAYVDKRISKGER